MSILKGIVNGIMILFVSFCPDFVAIIMVELRAACEQKHVVRDLKL